MNYEKKPETICWQLWFLKSFLAQQIHHRETRQTLRACRAKGFVSSCKISINNVFPFTTNLPFGLCFTLYTKVYQEQVHVNLNLQNHSTQCLRTQHPISRIKCPPLIKQGHVHIINEGIQHLLTAPMTRPWMISLCTIPAVSCTQRSVWPADRIQ